jgi:hypothetical protein
MVNNKNKKFYVNGVELVPHLLFTGWQPGFEYTKNLVFKNLNTKTIRLSYKYSLKQNIHI